MWYFYNNYLNVRFLAIFLIILTIFNYGCAKKDEAGKKVLIEVNPDKKAADFRDKGGGIFGDINNKKSSGTNFEFTTSNVLWRATLKSLDFLPLTNVDYSGGVIIYDWYSVDNSKEQIKISVQFLNNELRSDSVKIIAHKKICDSSDRCSNSKIDQNFSDNIKEKIITAARLLKIEEIKKEKK